MIRKFIRLSGREKMLFLEALLLHLLVGLLLKIIPFRRIPGLFKSRQPAISSQQPELVQHVKDAVIRAGRVSPWKNRCLVSSLSARRMLNRRHIISKLSLGVAKNSGGTTVAHAWLSSGNIEITGKHGDYQELFVF